MSKQGRSDRALLHQMASASRQSENIPHSRPLMRLALPDSPPFRSGKKPKLTACHATSHRHCPSFYASRVIALVLATSISVT
ncbi:hypothetical protein DOTSEDRAFT_74579 [Dothistroma septosporum NZE10]|uniref:Uncharacterized protein n=1 Tax=Dothistroma septosporum (strain NZE10 / CBS 128990) TaxID=675120 RepID=N1PEP2_DOTSN|nr:hypothetical protein DOTSEDRAFT_74579 [Dothistroma septosporum NZE10]